MNKSLPTFFPPFLRLIYLCLLIGSCGLFASCGSNAQKDDVPLPVAASAGDTQDVMSNLYQQKAAEYKALCLQAYNLAKHNVEDSLRAKKKKGLPLAITPSLRSWVIT